MTDLKDKVQDIESMRKKAVARTDAPSPRYASGELFANSSEIRIDHNSAIYALRITRSSGLLLNK